MATGNSRDAMIAAIAYELGQRSDLVANGTILRYINNAIEIYQKERFRFNENSPLTPFTINTVQGRYIYSAADDARIPKLYKIDYINYLLGNTTQQMRRVFPENIYLATIPGQQSGPPSDWAWDGQCIAIYPGAPAQVYPLTIGGYLRLDGPTDGADTTNAWMNDAEMLIRSRAKYEIAVHVTRNNEMQEAMSPIMPPPGVETGHAAYWAYCMLKGEASKIRGTSRIRGMPF